MIGNPGIFIIFDEWTSNGWLYGGKKDKVPDRGADFQRHCRGELSLHRQDGDCARVGGCLQVRVPQQAAAVREIAAVFNDPQLLHGREGPVRGSGGGTAQEGVDTTPGVPL